jgi:hypothetical protein
MKLTFCTLAGTIQAEILPEQFKRLRDPSITPQEISEIAAFCGVEKTLLINYVADINLSAKEIIEIDGSCDYSDHL